MLFSHKYYSCSLLLVCVSLAATARGSDWNRGVAFYTKGDYQAALAEFQDIAREQPDIAGAWYYIGLCEFKLKRYKRADSPLSHAVDLLQAQTPESVDLEGAWYTLGFSRYLLNQYDAAVDPLKSYLDHTSKAGRKVDPTARRALGRSYFFLEKYDEALALLTSAPADDQTKENAYDLYCAGVIYFKRTDDDNAVPVLQSSNKINPGDAATLLLLTQSLIRKAGKSRADADWQSAVAVAEQLDSAKDDLDNQNLLGRAYFGARQFDKAAGPLEKVAKAKPDDGQAWLLYGIALSRSGQSRKAMEALEITIQIAPESIPALSELAYVYESDKQYQQALRIYEKVYAAGGSTDSSIKDSIDRVRALAAEQH
jgi:tetratricopeptide (TPR) repeat protein